MEQNSVKNVNTPKVEAFAFAFAFGEGLVRVVIDQNGEPWFVAVDVCKILDLDTSYAVKGRKSRNFEDGIANRYMDNVHVPHPQSPNKTIEVLVLKEAGLYQLIFKSRKPEAKAFQEWVFDEVLPALRKTGKYEMPTEEEDFDENGTAITMKGAVQKMDYEAQAALLFCKLSVNVSGKNWQPFSAKNLVTSSTFCCTNNNKAKNV